MEIRPEVEVSPEPSVAAVGKFESSGVGPDVEAVPAASDRPLAPSVAATWRRTTDSSRYDGWRGSKSTNIHFAT